MFLVHVIMTYEHKIIYFKPICFIIMVQVFLLIILALLDVTFCSFWRPLKSNLLVLLSSKYWSWWMSTASGSHFTRVTEATCPMVTWSGHAPKTESSPPEFKSMLTEKIYSCIQKSTQHKEEESCPYYQRLLQSTVQTHTPHTVWLLINKFNCCICIVCLS